MLGVLLCVTFLALCYCLIVVPMDGTRGSEGKCSSPSSYGGTANSGSQHW